jgi:hypothetical protein
MSHTKSNQALAETKYENQNWTDLKAGEDVDVEYPDGHIEKAKIDAKSPDSRIVWLLTYAGHGRKMYGAWEGVCLTPSARDHGRE